MAMRPSGIAMGPGTRLSYAAARAARVFPLLHYHRYRFLAVPVSGMPPMPRGYRVEAVEVDALQGRIDAGAETIAYRVREGMTPLAAFRGDRLVGVNWLTSGTFAEDEVRALYRVPPNAAWDTGLWIARAERMSRAFAALWAGTRAWLEARDLEWSISRVADYNLASIRPHFGMGAIDLGTATFVGLGKLQMSTRGHPRVSLCRAAELRLAPPPA